MRVTRRTILGAFGTSLFTPALLRGALAAPAHDPTRLRWEHDGGFVARAPRWQEKTGDTTNELVETARNPVFVDLFDPRGGRTLRLHDDRMLVRGGKDSAGAKIVKFTRQADGKWEDGAARTKWASAAGSLEAHGAAWFEPVAHGVNMFDEKTRTSDFVELHDPGRDYTIRLSASAMQVRGSAFKDFTRIHAGGWTAVAAPARITMTPDVSESPASREWAHGAKELAERWYPIITQRLSPNASPAPRNYQLNFKATMKVPAVTAWGGRPGARKMNINAAWIEKHPNDWGMVIHELTHAVQEYSSRRTKHATWLTEGIADYMRYFEYEPEKPLPPFPKKTYRDGYRTAASFLNWVAQTYDGRLIEKLHASMLADAYDDDLFRRITGRTVDQLWAEHHPG